jgi:hypothetical protein
LCKAKNQLLSSDSSGIFFLNLDRIEKDRADSGTTADENPNIFAPKKP